MKFGPVAIADAAGAILAHAVRTDELVLRKGHVLSSADIEQLERCGVRSIIVARAETGDVHEDTAAGRIADRLAGAEVRCNAASTGRVNLHAEKDGLLVLDAERISALNALNEAITFATLPPFARVSRGQMVATIKIIPFALPGNAVEDAIAVIGAAAAVRVAPFKGHRAGFIATQITGLKNLADKGRDALVDRLRSAGSTLGLDLRVRHEPAALAAAIRQAVSAGVDPILVLGASATTDRRDTVPTALEMAGGRIIHFGMPVDPGNLLLLGVIEGRRLIGLPSCARSPKLNGFDYVLWRLLADLPVGTDEIASMGVGGLLADVPRPSPRDRASTKAQRRVAAIILAAGNARRMGSNKLLEPIEGKAMIRHVAEAALASQADPVIVVTGNEADRIEAALSPLPLLFTKNDAYSTGLSSSLKQGVSAIPARSDGVVVLLGDMPGITPQTVDALITAFDPTDGRGICVAARHGQKGNPVLWGRAYFDEILSLDGDVGARALMAAHPEAVWEVEAADDGPVLDIDTPDALAEYRKR